MTTIALPFAHGINPIWQKSLRSRMRLRHLMSWGVVTVTLTAFVSFIIYLTMTEQEGFSRADAAMAVLPGLLVIQAVLLMIFGTNAVAAGVSQERDEGLLDYQRMTPMSPTAKILGYLFGLPAREYVLFAMTLPFVAAAVAISGFSLLTLAHFYVVFFTSVLVYHMTALVAGMVAPKARLATMMSVGMVFALYFVLPNLSRVGITFFEFLTIRPTFFGLIQQEMPESMRAPLETSGIDSFRAVPFFNGSMHPTWYTMIVQGFVLSVMFSIVHRKWRNESNLVLSKAGAFGVFSGVLLFVLASVWALVAQDGAYNQIFGLVNRALNVAPGQRSPETLEMLLMLSLAIVSVTYLIVIGLATPERDKAIEGWRRAKKLGKTKLGFNADAQSSLPLALAMLAVTIAAGAAIIQLANTGGRFWSQGPSPTTLAVLAITLVGIALFVQGLRERVGTRVFGVTIFLLWMVPLFTMMISFAAFERFILGSYIGLPFPPVSLGYSIGQMMQTTTPLDGIETRFLPLEMRTEAATITVIGAIGYAAAALLIQISRLRCRRSLRAIGMASEAPAV